MILKKSSSRLGVYVFYDKDGIVDEYVLFMLDSLKDATDDIIIYSNCFLSDKEIKKLKKYTDKVHIRENVGLDAGAFKEAYDNYHEYFKEFDELILMNDTFYGPFKPFKQIFKEMENKDVDFWGLTANYDSEDGFGFLPDRMIHSHIQTFFVAYRSNVLQSDAFNDYWQKYDIKTMNDFLNVVTRHEVYFTHYLEQNGFKWDTYADMDRYHGKSLEENYNTYAYSAYSLIKDCNTPFIKRKNFVFDKLESLHLTDGNDAAKALKYIQDNNLYDVNIIMNNLIRQYRPIDLYYGLNMNYIIENKKVTKYKYAIIINLKEEKYLYLYLDLLKRIQDKNVYVYSINNNIIDKLNDMKFKININKKINKKDYDYICQIVDDYVKNVKIPSVYENQFFSIVENSVDSKEYINGLLETMHKNNLGLMLIPNSYHSKYYEDYSVERRAIMCQDNCCFIKSEYFNEELISNYDFVSYYLNESTNKKYLFGKAYNVNVLPSMLLNQDYMLKEINKSLKRFHKTPTNNLTNELYNIRNTKAKESIEVKLSAIIKKVKRLILKIIRKIKKIFRT